MRHGNGWAIVAAAVLALGLTGCQDGGLKIGQMTLIYPKTPMAATRVVLSRGTQQPQLTTVVMGVEATGGPTADAQVLTINLESGHATLTPPQGQVFPVQLSPERINEVRALVADRSWIVGLRKADKKAKQVTWYELAVYDGDKLLEREVGWAVPSAKELPASAQTLIRTFEAADRAVNPLSENVDLLK
jgi:hypothetical protein